MNRHEIAAIIGAYSRHGYSCRVVGNCFQVAQYPDFWQLVTLAEARKDVGINFDRAQTSANRGA